MNSQLRELADALEATLRGDLNAQHFRRQFPCRGVTSELEQVLAHLEHFFSDADIRERDTPSRSCAAIVELQIFWRQARAFRNSGQHSRTDLLVIVECKDKVWPIRSRERLVRAGLSF